MVFMFASILLKLSPHALMTSDLNIFLFFNLSYNLMFSYIYWRLIEKKIVECNRKINIYQMFTGLVSLVLNTIRSGGLEC